MSKYHDMDGNPTTLHALCSDNPAWAKNRIETLLSEGSICRKALSEIIRECSQENCDGEPYDTFQSIAREALDLVSEGQRPKGQCSKELGEVLSDALAKHDSA